MEPVTTAMVVVYLADLGAGVAAEEVTAKLKRLLANKSQRRRIATATAKVAANEGIDLRPAQLREWLRRADVQDQLVRGTHESVETAVKRLAWMLEGGTDEQRLERAVRIIEITCQQYLLALSPKEATAVSAAQTQALVKAEHETTRQAMEVGLSAVVDRLDEPAVFEESLTHFHPWRAEEARRLAGAWPPLREVVDLLARSRDRRALLASWAASTPAVLQDAPGPVWCWIGQLAKDYGGDHAAELITRGIERGVPDPDYWWARTAMATQPEDDGVEQPRRDLLQRALNAHPLGRAQLAFLDRDFQQVDGTLTAWEPEGPGDTSIKAVLVAESARAQGELDLAISILEDAAAAAPEATGQKVHLAELLLARGYRGETISRIKDFTQAQALAIQARDARRQWGGDSVEAALVAIKASALASDLNRTWQLTQTEPDGNASPNEAADPRIRREAAVLAAMTMRTDEANRLAHGLADPYTTELVAGYHALNDDDYASAETHWTQAWDAAADDFTRLQVARSLAPLGLRLPDLDDLAADHPDMVAEIRAIHDVMATATGQRPPSSVLTPRTPNRSRSCSPRNSPRRATSSEQPRPWTKQLPDGTCRCCARWPPTGTSMPANTTGPSTQPNRHARWPEHPGRESSMSGHRVQRPRVPRTRRRLANRGPPDDGYRPRERRRAVGAGQQRGSPREPRRRLRGPAPQGRADPTAQPGRRPELDHFAHRVRPQPVLPHPRTGRARPLER